MNNVAKQKKNGGSGNKKTLDIQHSTNLAKIHEMRALIDNIKKELKAVQHDINMFLHRKQELLANNGEVPDEEMEAYLAKLDKKLDLEADLNMCQNKYDETQYYINTADILYKYYDLVENGNDVSTMVDTELVNQKNPNTILKYFVQPSACSCSNMASPKTELVVESFGGAEESRGALLERYMMYTDDNFVEAKPREHDDRCSFCKSTNMTIMTNDGYAFCNDCHTMEYLIIDHDKPSYKDPPKEISYFAYKRINHFQEFPMWSGFLTFIQFLFKNLIFTTTKIQILLI